MPIYEYKCAGCGSKFERLMHRATDIDELSCPACGEKHVEQQLSTFSAHAGGSAGDKNPPMCPSGGVCRTPGACGLN